MINEIVFLFIIVVIITIFSIHIIQTTVNKRTQYKIRNQNRLIRNSFIN